MNLARSIAELLLRVKGWLLEIGCTVKWFLFLPFTLLGAEKKGTSPSPGWRDPLGG